MTSRERVPRRSAAAAFDAAAAAAVFVVTANKGRLPACLPASLAISIRVGGLDSAYTVFYVSYSLGGL